MFLVKDILVTSSLSFGKSGKAHALLSADMLSKSADSTRKLRKLPTGLPSNGDDVKQARLNIINNYGEEEDGLGVSTSNFKPSELLRK